MDILTILNTDVLDNSIWLWGLSLLATIVAAILLNAIVRLIARHLKKMTVRPVFNVLNLSNLLLKRTSPLFILLIAMYLGTAFIHYGRSELRFLDSIATAIVLAQVAWWLDGIITFYADQILNEGDKQDPSTVVTIQAASILGRWALWVILLLLVLDNFGVNINSLVAGLGVTGIATALAVQGILRDVLGSFTIMLDKPFLVGHHIVVGDFEGIVEKVGIRTTHLRSVSGEQVVFSNHDLADSRIQNYKRMDSRRVTFSFTVTNQIPVDKLKAIPDLVREVIEAQSPVRFEHAQLERYAPQGLIFEVAYHVLTSDYKTYTAIRHKVNEALYERLAEESIQLAP